MTDKTTTLLQGTADREWFVNHRRALFRAAIDDNTSFDSEKTASELARILHENDPKKRLRKRIAQQAWPDNPDTKYFYKLLIHPGKKPIPTNLQKRPRAYWEVGRALAQCLGLPEDTFTLRLFEGTAIAQAAEMRLDRENEHKPADEAYIALAEGISEMTEAVSRQNDFASFCRTIANTSGRYNPHDRTILDGNRDALLTHGPLEGNFEVVEEWPPIPSIELYRARRCPDFDSTLAFAPDALPEEMGVDSAWREAVQVELTAAWKKMTVRVTCWREVRLAIGPADASLQPRPLFELRTVFELSSPAAGEDIELLTPWQYDHSDSAVVVRIGKDRHVARVDLRPATHAAKNTWENAIPVDWPIGEQGEAISIQHEHPYAAWRTVTADLCEQLLGVSPADGEAFMSPLPTPEEATLTLAGTMGQRVENAVLSGLIEQALTAEAARLKALVDDYRAGKHAAAIARHTAARQRWRLR